VKSLRQEAYEVKDCFTKFSFQASALNVVALGLIIRFQGEFPLSGFAAVPIVIFLLSVARIGLHKYETANRHYGYELHLYRRSRLNESQEGGWKNHMRNIGWEEALYAWRVVQPVIYEHLYKKYPWVRSTRKTDHYKSANPKWFVPAILAGAEQRPAYYAGSYHDKIDFVLHSFAIITALALPYMCWQLFNELTFQGPFVLEQYFQLLLFGIAILVTVGTAAVITVRILRVRAKRRILQDELLSINSCAILWLAVVVAHFRALEAIGAAPNDWKLKSYENYTLRLAEQARVLRDHMPHIYDWVNQAPSRQVILPRD